MAFRPSAQTRSSQTLFDLAIHAEWDKIVEIYKNSPDAHTTKITKSGDSALHLAVQDGKDEVVKKLVGLIVKSHHPDKWVEVLGVKNKRGDTPLHFAASMGNLPMCYELAHSKPELIGLHNTKGETPLFVAASNGKKDAFLYLHSLIPDTPEAPREKTGMSYSRRANGDTFLHCALEWDYLELAFQIIHLYGDLGNYMNEQGYSPLHLLATNPSVFRSGSPFGIIDGIIYNFFFFLKNVYVHFYDFFLGLFESLGRRRSTAAERATDTESQVPVRLTNQVLPPNYDTIFNFLKLVCKAMFIILGVGPGKIENILEKKEKHTWSRQIMEKLLEDSSVYQYYHNGQEPGNRPLNEDGGSAPYGRNPEELLSRCWPEGYRWYSFPLFLLLSCMIALLIQHKLCSV